MRYAVAHGIAERNPVADVKPGDVLRARRQVNFARIEVAELPDLMRKIEAYAGSPYTRLAIRLMALTFVRTGELIGARWQEFDLESAQWRIPAGRTKSRREHFVPLSRQSIEVPRTLQEVRGADRCVSEWLLFPGERDHAKPMSNNTILKALERMGYKGRDRPRLSRRRIDSAQRNGVSAGRDRGPTRARGGKPRACGLQPCPATPKSGAS